MSDESWNENSDAELPTPTGSAALEAGSLLDDGADCPEESSLPLEARRRLADQLWLSALLTQLLHPGQTVHREALIQRVMAAIPAETKAVAATSAGGGSARSFPRRSWLATAASLAAVFLIGIYVFAPQAGPKTALAAVEHSLQAAAQDVDRQYEIQMTRDDGVKRPPIQLSVRGEKNFVWEQPVPHGIIRVGSNSADVWMVPVLGPVMVAPRDEFERLFLRRPAPTPILNISTALEWMRDRYDLKLLPKSSVPESEESTKTIRCVHYQGQLRERSDWFLPETMEIWSDVETGVVQRAVMTWPGKLPATVNRAELRLKLPVRRLPPDWFEHAAHHDPLRLVIAPPMGVFPVPEEAGAAQQ